MDMLIMFHSHLRFTWKEQAASHAAHNETHNIKYQTT